VSEKLRFHGQSKFAKNLRRQMKTTSVAIAVVCLFNQSVVATTPGGLTREMCDRSTNTCVYCTSHIIEDTKDCVRYIKGNNGRRSIVKVCNKKRVTVCEETLVQFQAPIKPFQNLPDCQKPCNGSDCTPCNKDAPVVQAQELISAKNGEPTGVAITINEKTQA